MPNYRSSPQILRRVLPLGTGAVTTATYLLGAQKIKGRITDIRFYGQSAVTGTSLTAEVFKVATDGNSTTTLQSAATDVKITASTDGTKLAASLTATKGDLDILKDQLLQVVITANTVGTGPGDLVVEVVYDPR